MTQSEADVKSTAPATAAKKPVGGGTPVNGGTPGPIDIRSLALTGLFLLALFHTLHVAKSLVLPILLAILGNLVLTPAVRRLAKLGVPMSLAAALVLSTVLGTLALGVAALSDPATEWAARIPSGLRTIERRIRPMKRPFMQFTEATEKVEDLTSVDSSPPRVEIKRFSLAETLLSQTQGVIAVGASMVALLYFLLASGDTLIQKVTESLPRLRDKVAAVKIIRTTESEISRYLITITSINLMLGLAVVVLAYFMNMPNPILWGAMAAVFNFVPFIGALITAAILFGGALIHYDHTSQSMVLAASFYTITCIEGLFVTPAILGRRLTLSPVAVFVSLLLWSWLWGVPGALIAVPTLASVKIVCDQVSSLKFVGTLLGN